MPNKEFLETYPLYKKFRTYFTGPTSLCMLPKPAINMFCNNCNSVQTYNMINEYNELDDTGNATASGNILRAQYICSACKPIVFEMDKKIEFFLRFDVDIDDKDSEMSHQKLIVEKVGQYPPWSIEIDKGLKKELGQYEKLFRKGLIC
jgi:hypothetical protein